MTALSIAVMALVAFVYYEHDPSSPAAPKCLFRLLTGYDCPGCGSQRALHALLNGHVAEAWGYNPFVFFAVPAGCMFIIAEAAGKRHPRLREALINPAIIAAVLAAIIAWWILRNC